MAEVKFDSKAVATQLLKFLDSLPAKDFPNMSTYRKILGGINEIKKGLGDYYTTLVDLEQDLVKALQPFHVEAQNLLAEAGGDEKNPKYMVAMNKLNLQVSEDKEVEKKNDKIRIFKEKNDKPGVSIAVSSEYINSIKEEWEKKAHTYTQWQPGMLSSLDDLIKTL